ncbi:hypothetical protein [Pseudescherichia sp.]|uniref:hypothetical protein n=1 Tax=Pseudescherichia sp. TaxID=2055881 RepID=UPI0028B10147|nr:hypothetical protein [Pseudescherichia sp.]
MTLSKEKFDHILAYAKQQQNLGVHHCNILPDDMVAIMEMAAGKQERRERGKQEPLLKCSTRTCAAPPEPVVPKNLPCPVLLEPGLRFGKGVPTQTMLDALQRRAEYYAELEAMTPEQRADHDAGMKEFATMLQSFGNSEQLNSPAVPDGWVAVPAKHTSAMYYAGGELISKHNFNPGDIWQAMLAAAPKQESE